MFTASAQEVEWIPSSLNAMDALERTTGVVERVSDGDTLTVRSGGRRATVRMLGIDTPELHYRGRSQGIWAERAHDQLRRSAPPGSAVTLLTDRQSSDQYGRTLAYVLHGRSNLNLTMVRAGLAVCYSIYPNTLLLEELQAATEEAAGARRRIFGSDPPLCLLPYEFRQRVDGRPPAKFCGDTRTRRYVRPEEYTQVPIARRLFFFSESEAREAGYLPAASETLAPAPPGWEEVSLLLDRPRIYSTHEWGARPPRRPVTVLAGRPTQIIIHHTTNANTAETSLAHAYQLARQIQRFHMDAPDRRWIDTGQHFTISRGGHILEGRHRSLERAIAGRGHVLGAHAGDSCNRSGIGIENEGLYSSALPPPAQWRSLVTLCAWLCRQYGIAPARIRGHRECKPTECPGHALFTRLPVLRQDVASRL